MKSKTVLLGLFVVAINFIIAIVQAYWFVFEGNMLALTCCGINLVCVFVTASDLKKIKA